jgi:phenylacetate-CoA ligase
LGWRGTAYLVVQRASGRNYSSPGRVIRNLTESRELLAGGEERFLRDLLSHAYGQIPYYSEAFRRCGLVTGEGIDMSKFGALPPLTRKAVRSNPDQLISQDFRSRRAFWDATGGSTGEPVHILKDSLHDSWTIATLRYHYKEMLGIDYLRARKFFLGNPFRYLPLGAKRTLADWLTNSVHADGLRLSDATLEAHVRAFNAFQPDVLISFPSVLYEVARFIDRKGKSVHRPEAIISSGEALQDYMREEIESAFGAKAYDLYGAVEAPAIAGECSAGLMHLFTFHNHVEILTANGSVEGGEVVVTPLHNLTMPLIRYRLGDVVHPGPKSCSCGSPLPTLGRVSGRTLDYFLRRDGGLVNGLYFVAILRSNRSLEAFQVVQEDYETIRILVKMSSLDGGWREETEGKVRLAMGTECRIIWEEVEEVPRTKYGKYSIVKSLVNRE